MALDDTLALPFFDDGHRRFAEEISRWADSKLHSLPHDDVDEACRARVKALGEAGFLKAVVPSSHGGLHPVLDVRTLCIAREILGFRDGLADFAFALPGPARAVLAVAEVRHIELRQRNADQIAPFAADHFAVGDVFPQVLADFAADDLAEATMIVIDVENHGRRE